MPALSAVALLALIAAFCGFAVQSTPVPSGKDEAPTSFSAGRAKEHIEQIARAPHPSGSEAADRVRAHVEGELRKLGLNPSVQEATEVLPGSAASHLAGRVHNITATVPGRSSTGRILLVAHTDSTSSGPGASDDGLGVGAVLEIARVLKAGERTRNDVVLLFTDAEEIGQLGARAYVRNTPTLDPRRDVVINIDARGTTGPAVMFQTGERSAGVVGALGDRPPVTTSLADEVYRLLPNETDFTHFRDAGLTGLNFAVIGGSSRYHSTEDDIEHLDSGSLQDLGATALSATRSLAGADLEQVAGASDATWFNVGPVLVRYPAGAVLPLAGAALLAAVAAGWYARRRRALRPRKVAVAAAAFPLVLVAAGAIGWASWQVLLLVKPAYGRFTHGDPYRPELIVAAMVLLVVAVAWGWTRWARTRTTPVESLAAVLVWLVALAVATALALPGACYLFTWTALAGAAALALTVRLAEESPWRPVALALPGLPAAVLIVPLVVLLFPAVQLVSAAAPLVFAALVAVLLLLPPAHLAGRPRAGLAIGLALALSGVALLGVGAAVDGTDRGHPLPVSLMYARDLDRSRAYWVSENADPDSWVAHYTDGAGTSDLEKSIPALPAPPGGHLVGDAPAVAVAEPVVRTVSDERVADGRRLTLSVSAERGRSVLTALYVDTSSTEVVKANLAGAPGGSGEMPGGENRSYTATPWKWGFVHAAPPAEGFTLTLTVRGDGPVRLLAMTEEAGLPASALDRPLPGDRAYFADEAGLSLASRTYTF
ncbi:M20/M25/M40 family metallo-hydrolase [Streptomyces sp. NPDC059999]|uniref:M20/M25/M40 family metallo-hydrolase n=1 Tax=Streptomyces sp. NPDC059999 TaxID=3347030 RepID=UPI0036A722C1